MIGKPDDLRLEVEEYRLLREIINRHSGIYFSIDSRAILERKLRDRLVAQRFSSFGEYCQFLRSEKGKAELDEAVDLVTVNETYFFREDYQLRCFQSEILPALARDIGPKGRLHVWSAGCSTGEEPYTIAITLAEAFGLNSGWDIKILASDIDTQVLATAEQGVYPEHRIGNLPESVKRAHFLRGKGESAGLVRVRPELQKLVTFRRINFIETPWPIQTTFDVIFCRNVIIYFDRDTQRRLFQRMREKIAQHGYLFVGHSENLYWLRDIFEPVQSTVYIPNSI